MWFLSTGPLIRISGRILEDLYCPEKMKIVDLHCRFLVRLHFSMGCDNRCRISAYPHSIQFLLSMCIDAPECTTNFLFSDFVEDRAGKHQTSEGEQNVALSFSLCVWVLFAISQTISADASTSFQGFFLRSVFKFWSMGIRSLGSECFITFPESLRGVMYFLRIARRASVPRILGPSVKSTWISGSESWNTQLNCLEFFNKVCRAVCQPLCTFDL